MQGVGLDEIVRQLQAVRRGTVFVHNSVGECVLEENLFEATTVVGRQGRLEVAICITVGQVQITTNNVHRVRLEHTFQEVEELCALRRLVGAIAHRDTYVPHQNRKHSVGIIDNRGYGRHEVFYRV